MTTPHSACLHGLGGYPIADALTYGIEPALVVNPYAKVVALSVKINNIVLRNECILVVLDVLLQHAEVLVPGCRGLLNEPSHEGACEVFATRHTTPTPNVSPRPPCAEELHTNDKAVIYARHPVRMRALLTPDH